MEAKKSNQMRKEEGETKTAVNDQRNFTQIGGASQRRKAIQTKTLDDDDEPKTDIHQEVQLHQQSEA